MKKIMLSMLILIVLNVISCTDKNMVGVALKSSEELTTGDSVPFLLYQNYPNPFNPTTVIRFDVAKTIKLKLTVFTSDWVEVGTLINDVIVPSYRQVDFEAKGYPSGDYFYMREGGGYKIIRKMKLSK